MPTIDLEACQTFIAANRLIADRFREKADEAFAALQAVDNIDSRLRFADLAGIADQRAMFHEAVATRQERDLGVACHCPTRRRG